MRTAHEPAEPGVEGAPAGWDWAAWLWLAYWVGWVGVLVIGCLQAFVWTRKPGEGPVGLLAAFIGGLAGGLFWWRWYAQRRRTAALAGLSRELGLTFLPKAPEGALVPFGGLPLFQAGRDHRAWNVLKGRVRGNDVVAMDYRYTLGHGKEQVRVAQTVVVFPRGAAGLPEFELQPKYRLRDTPAYKLLYNDRVEDLGVGSGVNEEFVQRYRVSGPDPGAVRRHFTPERLRQLADLQGWRVEAYGGQMAVYREMATWKPWSWRERFEQAGRLRDVLAHDGPGK
jgi:hypothetical protein